MPLRNRVDPFGDLHTVAERGLFTGNRGCLVDDRGRIARHHRGDLWITCVTEFGGRRVALLRPGRWTPIFFLDDAVALAAGHRPCGECRRDAYRSYRGAVTSALGRGNSVSAGELNARLRDERLRAGRGLERAADRLTWTARAADLPDGTVVLDDGHPHLLAAGALRSFSFGGWGPARPVPGGELAVLTPPTSVLALAHGFVPVLHPSAAPG
jgi:hypothetical protein